MSIGPMLSPLDSRAEHLVALCAWKDHPFDLAEDFFAIYVVQLNMQWPALPCEDLVATFVGAVVVILVSEKILLLQALWVDAGRERFIINRSNTRLS